MGWAYLDGGEVHFGLRSLVLDSLFWMRGSGSLLESGDVCVSEFGRSEFGRRVLV